MRQKSETRATPEQIVKDIRRATAPSAYSYD